MSLKQIINSQILNPESITFLANKLARVTGLVLAGIIIKNIASFLIRRSTRKLTKSKKRGQRVKTISDILINTATISINFAVFLLILTELGFNIIPLITGVGILGLAIGMGAKDLASDLIAGFFVLLENHFNVGDTIKASGVEGKVRKMSLRTVTLKDDSGRIHIVPNSLLKTVTKIKIDKK